MEIENTNSIETDAIVDINGDGSDLFFDAELTGEDVEEASEEQADVQEGMQQEGEQDKGAPEEEQEGVEIVYNGERKKISLEEAATLAQKGMNYEKAVEREAKKAERYKTAIAPIARKAGMSEEQYIAFLEQQSDSIMMQDELRDIKAKDPNISDALAQEMAEMRIERAKEKAQREADARQKAEEAEKLKPWQAFVTRYPDMKDINKLPPDVISAIDAGASPIEAMQAHEIAEYKRQLEELNRKLEAKEKNQKNKDKTVGSVASTADNAQMDAFLMGFTG